MSKYGDGHIRLLTWDDLKPGSVVRMVTQEEAGGQVIAEVSPTYSDSTIVQVSSEGPHGTTTVRLARPYLYSTLDGTTAPGFLMGVEDFKVDGSRMIGEASMFRLVLLSTGAPARMARE